MELSFVISALRRRFWVVTLLAIAGALPGLLASPETSTEYESTATLSVQPPTRASVNVFSSNPDRYVVGEMAVLESQTLAEKVARRITDEFSEPISVQALGQLVTIEQVPESDTVEITTRIDDPQKAASISQAYAEEYIAGLTTTDEDAEQQTQLQAEIQELTNRLDSVNEVIREEMASHLPSGLNTVSDPIPPVEIIVPKEASQRTLLEADLARKQATLDELEQESRLRVNTVISSAAPIPLEPVPPGPNFVLAGGLAAGAILGIVVAVTWARFSAKVLDDVTAGEIIGVPVVAELPHYRSLARNPLAAFRSLPRSAVPVIDQLCVRAEALAKIGEPLTVTVAGTMRSAGTTTLALAMAERFAAGGASVVVVDGDVRDPRVTFLFNATADGGVPAVIANDGVPTDQRGRSAFTWTMDPAVNVLGLGPNRGAASLRRDTAPAVLEVARRKAEIVVIDGGPVLDLASTIVFASLTDAVVLAVPMARQKVDDLGDTGRQLESVSNKLLPVITSPSRRVAKGHVVSSDGSIAVHAAPVRAGYDAAAATTTVSMAGAGDGHRPGPGVGAGAGGHGPGGQGPGHGPGPGPQGPGAPAGQGPGGAHSAGQGPPGQGAQATGQAYGSTHSQTAPPGTGQSAGDAWRPTGDQAPPSNGAQPGG